MASVTAQQRQEYILNRLRANGMISTIEISRALHVSSETVRRDFIHLEDKGLLKRIYGGAIAPATISSSEPPHQERMSINYAAKLAMGTVAASLVSPTDTIFIDVGTTTPAIAQHLSPEYAGTVVTHSLLVANHLAQDFHGEVLIAPGRLRRGEWSVGGAVTHDFLDQIQYDIAFISCGGVDANIGITDYNLDDVTVKQTVATRSSKVYVLADSMKHNKIGTYTIGSWNDVSGLITDIDPPEGIRRGINVVGGNIHIPN